MAKLEEMVTPVELMSIIRQGASKSDLTKKFRTSDQELAKMLLPLYRTGELSKEEFNDFFKGVVLRKPETEPVPPKAEDEAPSEIMRSLSTVSLKKAPKEPQPPNPPGASTEEKAAEKTFAETEPVMEIMPDEPVPAAPPPPIISKPVPAPVAAPEIKEIPGRPAPEKQIPEEIAQEKRAPEKQQSKRLSSLEISELLSKIYEKLISIDTRLSAIEEKFGKGQE